MDIPATDSKAGGNLGRCKAFMEKAQDNYLGLGVRTGFLRHPLLKRQERTMSRDIRDICHGTEHPGLHLTKILTQNAGIFIL